MDYISGLNMYVVILKFNYLKIMLIKIILYFCLENIEGFIIYNRNYIKK